MALLLFVGFIITLAGPSVSYGLEFSKKDTLHLQTTSGRHAIQVEIADTPQLQAHGLMFRRSLADNHGMLFIYKKPENVTMWMRNTYISLDMVFIDKSGRVIRIEHNTEPLSDEVIYSGGKALSVLELKAGQAAKLKLKAGDKVLHRFFN